MDYTNGEVSFYLDTDTPDVVPVTWVAESSDYTDGWNFGCLEFDIAANFITDGHRSYAASVVSGVLVASNISAAASLWGARHNKVYI